MKTGSIVNSIRPRLFSIARQKIRGAQWHAERHAAYFRWRFGPVRRGGNPHELDQPLIVSLTSFPPRFKVLPLTLKCLLSQSIKADEVVLWIAHEDESKLSKEVLSLQSSGLSIRFCDDLKSFKKAIPAIEAYPGSYIVTADDDIYYRSDWLGELIAAWNGDRSEVVCHRAHKVRFDSCGNPLPYLEWEFETGSVERSAEVFPTGAGGVLYPPGIFDPRVTDRTLFMTLCPTADDIWLYWMMRLNGGTARGLGKSRLINWPDSQSGALWCENLNGRNDDAITRIIDRFGLPRSVEPAFSDAGVSSDTTDSGAPRHMPMPEMEMPLVSVVVPVKNRCNLLMETLASVQAQSYPRWEAVVVDDGSTDETWPTLQALAERDPRIRPIRRAGQTGGAPVARNQGFEASRGTYIVFFDSDDLLAPYAIEERVRAALANPEADAVVFQSEHFTDVAGRHGHETAYRVYTFDGVDPLDGFLAYHAPWYTCGPLWKREAVERVGRWDVSLPFGQDLEFHIRAILLNVRFERFAKVDNYHRGHLSARISNSNSAENAAKRLALLAKVTKMLRQRDMLTGRRRRMLAWSAFWASIGYVFERPRPTNEVVLLLWCAAREQRLMSAPAYAAGFAGILSAKLTPGGHILREVARLIFYNDLKGRVLLHPALMMTFLHQLRWAQSRYRMRARSPQTTSIAS